LTRGRSWANFSGRLIAIAYVRNCTEKENSIGQTHGHCLPGAAILLLSCATAPPCCDYGGATPSTMLSALAQRDPEVSRRERVRQLFITWYRAERTANDVLNFYLRLQQHDPGLLPQVEQRYTYRHLKADLDGLYLRER
jgi:hypothetical protein